MSLVEFLQVRYIDLSEMVHNLKISRHFDKRTLLKTLSTIFVVSHFLTFLSVRCPLNGTQKKCTFPLNRGAPSVCYRKRDICLSNRRFLSTRVEGGEPNKLTKRKNSPFCVKSQQIRPATRARAS